jgi:hypothetical protein
MSTRPWPTHLRIGLRPVRYLHVPEVDGIRTTLAELCERADVVLRYTGASRPILLYHGDGQYRARGLNIVGVPVADLASPEAALRALEALAYSFHDHGARACVCHQGLFVPRPSVRVGTRNRTRPSIDLVDPPGAEPGAKKRNAR